MTETKLQDEHSGSPACSPVPCSMPCHHCIEEFELKDPGMKMWPLNSTRMILCETCGNKRCPHASDHRLACSGSNDAGQQGSIYV